MKPNMHLHLIDGTTGAFIEDHEFYDSSLCWAFDRKRQEWYIHHEHTGEPTDEWLRSNPRPK